MAEPITLLINRTDITPYAQVALHSRDEAMLQPHILAAQNVDVKPALGEVLYTDMVANSLQEKYRLLLDGGSYTNDNSEVITFQGLKAALACFTYARYMLSKNAVDTPFGMVSKTNEYSVQTDTKLLLSIASDKRSEGSAYLNECLNYIRLKENLFPLFVRGGSAIKSIHKLNSASRI